MNNVEESPLPAWAQRLVVFDTETTGIAVETTRVVTSNISLLNASGDVLESKDWLINPGIDIPAQATAVHGISTEYARANGQDAAECINEIVECLRSWLSQGFPVVAYNAAYDFSIVDREARRYGVPALDAPKPIIDPLIIDKQLDRYRKGKRTLEATALNYGVDLTNAHTAAADAIAAGRVAQAIARKFATELSISADELHVAQVEWAADQAVRFADYLRSIGKQPYPGDGKWPVR